MPAWHPRTRPYQRLHVLSFELRRLRPSSSTLLSAALIEDDAGATAAEILRGRLVRPLEDVAVIEKCNAVIVVATLSVDADPAFVRELLLDRWLEVAPDLATLLPQINDYSGLRALEYLGEVSVGLRSVVLGDGQVHAQVVHGLRSARGSGDQKSPFSIISRRLGGLRKAVRNNTSLQEGNLSLERIAVDRLCSELGQGGATVAIVGYGQTGQLIAEVMSKETTYDLVVTNRTAQPEASTLPARVVATPWDDLSSFDSAAAVVICVTNTVGTRQYTERLLSSLSNDSRPLVVDMSSPSITRQIPSTSARIVWLDDLAAEASGSLGTRQRGVNKAKQIVSEWAETLERDLAASDARQSPVESRFAAKPESVEPFIRCRSEMLNTARAYMAGEGFLEAQTPCMVSTSDLGQGPRRSISVQETVAIIEGLDRIYEIGPVWSPDASSAPSDLDEAYLLAAGIRGPTDLGQVCELGLGLVEKVVQALLDAMSASSEPIEFRSGRLTYETAIWMLQENGYAAPYGSGLDFNLLRNIADVVRLDTGNRLVALTDCPEPRERSELARDPETGLARSFRIVLDGWQVASGSLRERDADVLRRRMILAGARVDPFEGVGSAAATGAFEVALDHLLTRCLASMGKGS